jgi:zinc D-Ala-D-Ala dipeptidase
LRSDCGPGNDETDAMHGWQDVPLNPIDEPLVHLRASRQLRVDPIYRASGYVEATNAVYVRRGVAERLREATLVLPAGLSLLIWDGWRPLALQQALYLSLGSKIGESTGLQGVELARAVSRYVSKPSDDPNCPSPHLTGGAVDLTLAAADGDALDMGGDFDEFDVRTRTDYYERVQLSRGEKHVRDRRRLLCHVMREVGFSNYSEEWWHFDLGNQFWGLLTGQNAYYGPITLAELTE